LGRFVEDVSEQVGTLLLWLLLLLLLLLLGLLGVAEKAGASVCAAKKGRRRS
jgi:hypothetical protein